MTWETLAAVLLAVALMVLLGYLGGRAGERSMDGGLGGEWQSRDNEGNLHARAAECVDRIFSREDQKYVREMKTPRLRALFERERKSLAHVWVDQTKRRIQSVLKEHVETARQSRELELGTEAKILLQYAELRMLCAMMDVCIECAGPERLSSAAHCTERISERLGEAQRALAMAEKSRALEGARTR